VATKVQPQMTTAESSRARGSTSPGNVTPSARATARLRPPVPAQSRRPRSARARASP
jgi:hypothetical protein